jgi:hypothetical protein
MTGQFQSTMTGVGSPSAVCGEVDPSWVPT